MAAFDASFILLLLQPDAKAPGNQPVEQIRERIETLISELQEAGAKIIIPTPALSEVLVRAGAAAPNYLDTLNNSARFRISPFDQRAAIEAAALTKQAIDSGQTSLTGLGNSFSSQKPEKAYSEARTVPR